MEIHDYLRILKERWRIFVFTTVAVTFAALLPSLFATPTYEASTLIYVSSQQPRLATYTQLLTGTKLADRTIEKLDLDLTASELRSKVTAKPVPEQLLYVTAHDSSPEAARDIANAISDEFVLLMDDLAKTENEATTADPRTTTPFVVTEPSTSNVSGDELTITTRDSDPRPARANVEQTASVPASPLPTAEKRNLALGLIVGMFLGLSLALLRDWLDATIKDQRRIEESAGVRVLGMIPGSHRGRAEDDVDYSDPLSELAAAYRQLRTNLQFMVDGEPPRVIVVTSPSPEEGVGDVARNLAVALSATGSSVCLVEADLRKPHTPGRFGLSQITVSESAGVSSVLAGDSELLDSIQLTSHPHLSLLPSGPTPSRPSELIASGTAPAMLKTLRARFDFIIVESAPLLPVPDSAVLSAMSDGALVVARYGQTKYGELSTAVGNLRSVGATVIGAVVTSTPDARRADPYRDYLAPQAVHQR